MTTSDDPVLTRLREICLALPGTREVESHGCPTFRTRKIFAVFGGTEKGAPSGTMAFPQAVLFLPDPEEVRLLLRESRFFTPAYYGPFGWVGLDLSGEVDWDEVRVLVEDSFRSTAPRTLVRALDASAAGGNGDLM
jgi:hypothetical protein